MRKSICNKKRINEEYWTILIVLSIVLLVRARFGFDNVDEPFYLAIIDRFWKGDTPIVDEWNPAQLFFIPLVPIYALYKTFFAWICGAIVFFRELAVFFSTIISMYLYNGLKSVTSKRNAFYISVLVMLYSRGNIPGIKYYDIYAYAIVLLFFWEIKKQRNKGRVLLYAFFQGIVLAIAILCMPYFAITLPFILGWAISRRRIHELVITVCGGLAVGLGVIGSFLSRCSRIQLLKCASYIMDNDEHSEGIITFLYHDLKAVVHVISAPGCLYVFAISIVIVVAKKGNLYEKHVKRMIAISFLLMVVDLAIRYKDINDPYAILAIYAFPCFLYTCIHILKGEERKLYIGGWLWGILAALIFGCASNVNVQALSTGLLLVDLVTLLGIEKYVELHGNTYIKYAFAIVLVSCLLQRVLIISGGDYLLNQNSKIKIGAYKGIYSSPNVAERYEKTVRQIYGIENDWKEDRMYISGWMMWAYADTHYKCGADTVWAGQSSTSIAFNEYYSVNPKNIPNVILVSKEDDDVISLESGTIRNKIGGKLADLYVNQGYDVKDCDSFWAIHLRNVNNE